jgi:hypothetical protein
MILCRLIATALDQFLRLSEEGNHWVNKNERKLNMHIACKHLSELLLPVKSCSSIEFRIKLVKNSIPGHPITVSIQCKIHTYYIEHTTTCNMPSHLLIAIFVCSFTCKQENHQRSSTEFFVSDS